MDFMRGNWTRRERRRRQWEYGKWKWTKNDRIQAAQQQSEEHKKRASNTSQKFFCETIV